MDSKKVLAAALVLAASPLAMAGKGHGHSHGKAKGKAAIEGNTKGKCFGIVALGKGECGGSHNGQTWSCQGHAPTVETTWVTKTKAKCEEISKEKGIKPHFEPKA